MDGFRGQEAKSGLNSWHPIFAAAILPPTHLNPGPKNKSMTQNRQGIDELMAAERQAADIIATARLLKKQRRTQADQDALTEIDAYKEKKTQEFDVVKTTGEGGQDESLQALAADAKQVCERLDNEFKANKDKTTDMLVKYVTNGLL